MGNQKSAVAVLVLAAGLAWVALSGNAARAAAQNPALVAAAKVGDTATVVQLLTQGVDPNSVDGSGVSALEWAAGTGQLATVDALVAGHAAVDGHFNPNKITPLMRAATFGFPKIVARLIERGADVNAKAAGDFTALYYAASENHADIVALLLRHGAAIDVVNSQGDTALSAAAQKGASAATRILLSHGADGVLALAKEIDHGVEKGVSRLLDDGVPVNGQLSSDYDFAYGGGSPLMVAAWKNNMGIATLLITRGADVNYVWRGNSPATPLMNAAFMCNADMIRLLLARGAKKGHRDDKGRSAYDVAQHTDSENPGKPCSDEIQNLLRSH